MGRRPPHTLTVIRKRGGTATRRVFLGAGRPVAQTHFARMWRNPSPAALGHREAGHDRQPGSRRPFPRGTRNFSDLAVGRMRVAPGLAGTPASPRRLRSPTNVSVARHACGACGCLGERGCRRPPDPPTLSGVRGGGASETLLAIGRTPPAGRPPVTMGVQNFFLKFFSTSPESRPRLSPRIAAQKSRFVPFLPHCRGSIPLLLFCPVPTFLPCAWVGPNGRLDALERGNLGTLGKSAPTLNRVNVWGADRPIH